MTLKPLMASEAGIAIRSSKDIMDAVGVTFGSPGLILTESDLTPEFFDLRSGLAGELFQKFINYQLRLALVVPTPRMHGERFDELAHEHQTHGSVRIFASRAEAADWICGGG